MKGCISREKITFVSPATMYPTLIDVIDDRKPPGLFIEYSDEDELWYACDNSTEEALVEEFMYLEDAVAFLHRHDNVRSKQET